MLRRTCAKTPVFCVGQLESKTDAQSLAQYYQGLLPPRLMTPLPELDTAVEPEYAAAIFPVRTIRKMKRSRSLRSLCKKHERCESLSDSETLVGSESPKEPLSPWMPQHERKLSSQSTFNCYTPDDDPIEEMEAFDNDMALKKCMELLSNELSAVIAEQQPLEGDIRRSSGLQILLMIESYEKIQQHLRQNIEDHEKGQIKDVERILEYWLKVLYSVYDRSYESETKEHEEYFPPPLSFVTNQKPPRRSIQRKPLPIPKELALSGYQPLRADISC